MSGPLKKSSATDTEVSLGWIVGLHGVGGEVRVHLHNRDSDFFAEKRELELVHPDGERRRVKMSTRPGAKNRVLGRVEGLEGRDQARNLMGWELIVPKTELPDLEGSEFYHHELIGLDVVLENGEKVGVLTEIQSAGPVDMWIVKTSEDEVYLPALEAFIVEVDLVEGRVVLEDGWNSNF
jgi:16S rRNA processing protein RimM